MPDIFQDLDWKILLLGSEKWSFLFETVLRTLVMFLVILFGLRLLGKRGVKQLSVFELGVIIGLGSAAGDPMFYKDVGLLPGILVFFIVIGMYSLITFFINRSNAFEKFLEGSPTCILKDGRIQLHHFKHETIATDEFFSQLRLNSVSHLGQVQEALIETNGEISIFYFPDEEVRYGLPILPAMWEQRMTEIIEEDLYACTHCGYTEKLSPAVVRECNCCKKKEWLKASNKKRIK